MKTAIVAFFDAYPPKSGAGIVVNDFFNAWPDSKKCLFQMSTKIINKNKISNTKLIKNSSIFKILSLPILLLKLLTYFYNIKKKILIIEGASWVLYSYFVIFFLKLFTSNILFIYRAHNIEYEIRKRNSSLFISLITRYFEKKVFSMCDITTTVSKLEKKKIYQYYGIQTRLFPNSINISNFIKLKEKPVIKLPKRYILFSGSYEYLPNKNAIDYIIDKILPFIKEKNIHLVLTGSPNMHFNNDKVINLGCVKRSELKFLYKNAICLMATLFEGYGTRIKIIESLILQSNVISTSKGIEGIEFFLNNNKIIIANTHKKIINSIYHFMKQKPKNFKKYSKNYFEYYSMKYNTNVLYRECN